MKRDEVITFASVGAVAFFTALMLAWPLFPLRLEAGKALELGIGVFGNLAAAFAGAGAAFIFNARQEAKKKRALEVEWCNRALLVLARQFNFLLHFRTEVLDPNRADPARAFNVRPTPLYDMETWRVDAPSLAFLLGGAATEVPFGIALQDERFHASVQAINERSRFHREVVQSAIETALGASDGMPLAALEHAIGQRVSITIRTATDEMFEHVTRTVLSHESFIDLTAKLLRQAMPGEKFVVARSPAKGELASLSFPADDTPAKSVEDPTPQSGERGGGESQ